MKRIYSLYIVILIAITSCDWKPLTPGLKVAQLIDAQKSEGTKLPYIFKEGIPAFILKNNGQFTKLPKNKNTYTRIGRPFVISLNLEIPHIASIRKQLVKNLANKKLLTKVLFHVFSITEESDTIKVTIGTRIPLEISQILLKIMSQNPKLKIVLVLSSDNEYGNTQKVRIRYYSDQANKVMPRKKLLALLNPKLSLEEFHRLIP